MAWRSAPLERHELTDGQWELIEPLVPVQSARTGRPPRDRRQMLNGIFGVLATGAPEKNRHNPGNY